MILKYLLIILSTQINICFSLNSFKYYSNKLNGIHSNKFPVYIGIYRHKGTLSLFNSNNKICKTKSFSFINQNSGFIDTSIQNYSKIRKFSRKDDELVEDPSVNSELIRNFCIIAHVDHGKSTLADRFLEYTKSVSPDRLKDQYLDNMDLERERGITIKLQTALIKYSSIIDGKTYMLNLIDTPGHIDFNHECRRSISACEGAILVVDGTKGIEAQTVTTANIAIEKGLKIIPVVNKIDVQQCDFKATSEQLKKVFGFSDSEILKASAKMGIGIDDILESIVVSIPPPKFNLEKPFRALVFDSYYDNNRGAICYIRVFDGSAKIGDEVTLMNAGITSRITGLGVLLPEMEDRSSLQSGQVGWLTAGIKKSSQIEVGDTIALSESVKKNTVEPINKFEESKPMVFAGLFPCIGGDFDKLSRSLEKLKLNDHAFHYETMDSGLVGHGFKCGFNGLLHLDITIQRLKREFGTHVLVTSPSVPYRCTLRDKKVIIVDDASKWPDDSIVSSSEEPWTTVTIRTPQESVGNVMNMMNNLRSRLIEKNDLKSTNIVFLKYEVPMAEILSDFFNRLKSVTNGYGSYDYDGTFYEPIELCKIKILLNNSEAPGLAMVLPRNKAAERGKFIVNTLANLLPKKSFKIPVQASIGRKIIASCTIPAVKKDVTERCSGGDPSRKRKLLENQARGQKEMAQMGNVTIPPDAYNDIIRALRG